jgi:hypothetical protein
MDHCPQEPDYQPAANQDLQQQASSDLSLSRINWRESHRKIKMEYTQQNDQISMYQSNSRAEDGPAARPSLAIYEGVVIPLATLAAALLFVIGAIMLTH